MSVTYFNPTPCPGATQTPNPISRSLESKIGVKNAQMGVLLLIV